MIASCSYPKTAVCPLYVEFCDQRRLRELPYPLASILRTTDAFSETSHVLFSILSHSRELMNYLGHRNRDVLRSIQHLIIWGSLDACMEAWVFVAFCTPFEAYMIRSPL